MIHSRTSCAAAIAAFSFLGTAAAHADDFLQQEGDMWRASKLVGVNIYGPDKRKVGDVSDVLMGKDGKAAYIVVGVGGFLGIGEKDVAIPYDKVTFSQDTMAPAADAAPAGAANTSNTMAPAGTMAPADTMAMAPGNKSMAGMAPANTGMAPNTNTGLGLPAINGGDATGTIANPAATGMMANNAVMPARSTTYPDHGMVDYTADQLKAAPTFAYGK